METIEQEQIEKYYEQHFKVLRLYAYQFCQNWELAEEAVQMVFSRMLEQQESLQIQSSLLAYLYVAVRNQSLNLSKEASKTISLSVEYDLPTENESTDGYEQYSAMLQKAILTLPDQCRAILIKKRMEKMSYKEIAVEMNISSKTVENQMGIALKKLRAYFQNHLGEK